MIKSLRNVSGVTKQVLNVQLAHTETYTIPAGQFDKAADSLALRNMILAEEVIVNDGSDDLEPSVGIAHIEAGVVFEHSDISLLMGVGSNAPSLVEVSPAVIGGSMEIGDVIYGQSRLDRIIGSTVGVQIHLAIDNSVADRWIQFELAFRTTNGFNDKAMNAVDDTLVMGPFLVPVVPFKIFPKTINIPTEWFANGEKYLFLSVKRVVATGKTAPANDPIILRYCKEFYKKLE